MIDLIKAIAKRLKEQYGAKEVILFGSYAKGNPHEDSDPAFQRMFSKWLQEQGEY